MKAILYLAAVILVVIFALVVRKNVSNVKEVPERSVATPTTNQWHLTVTYQCTGLTEDVTLTSDRKPVLTMRGCIFTKNNLSGTYSICGVRSFTFN